MKDPVPFEIISSEGIRVASNGTLRVSIFEDEKAAMCRMRAISGLAIRPAAEAVIPLLNQLAGDLLANTDMAAEDVRNRILAISGMVPVSKPKRHEWIKVTVDDWKIYTDGEQVVITKKELSP